MNVEWTPRGERRRNEVCDYIRSLACDDTIAWTWEDRFFDEAARLADNPELGRIVPEIHRPEIRELIIGKSYRLIYKRTLTCCYILSIRHHLFSLKSIRSL